MIFNDDFDKSLLLLFGDIRNRKKIMDFVESIPSELVLSIRDCLIEYDKYKRDNEGISYIDREYMTFNNQIYNNVGELYSFNIDVRRDMLTITKSIYVMGAYYKNFSIELINMNRKIDTSKMKDIGIVWCPVNVVGSLKKIGYGIMDIGVTNVLVTSVNNDIYRFCRFVNVDKDVNLELDKSSGRLIRIRKMKNGDDKNNV